MRTEANPEGFLLGKVEDYTSVLLIQQEGLRKRFVSDQDAWAEEVEMAEKRKAEFDERMKQFRIE